MPVIGRESQLGLPTRYSLAESLAEFARDQSVVVAPSSQQDAQEIAAMAAVGSAGAAPLTGGQAAALAADVDRPDGEGT